MAVVGLAVAVALPTRGGKGLGGRVRSRRSMQAKNVKKIACGGKNVRKNPANRHERRPASVLVHATFFGKSSAPPGAAAARTHRQNIWSLPHSASWRGSPTYRWTRQHPNKAAYTRSSSILSDMDRVVSSHCQSKARGIGQSAAASLDAGNGRYLELFPVELGRVAVDAPPRNSKVALHHAVS